MVNEIEIKDERVFETFDALDDEQVLAEIKGNFMAEFVYSFMQKGKEITGLSLVGVNETVREMNRRGIAKIAESETPPQFEETDDYIQIGVYAKDELNGGGSWGYKRQNKLIFSKDGSSSHNPFALEQALSKAQRNAKRKLIPEKLMQEFIKEFKSKGKVKTVTSNDIIDVVEEKQDNLKPPWVFDKTRGVYFPPEEIKEIFRLGYSVFNAKTKEDKATYKPAIMEKFETYSGKQLKSTKELTYGEIEKIRAALQSELDKANVIKDIEGVTDDKG